MIVCSYILLGAWRNKWTLARPKSMESPLPNVLNEQVRCKCIGIPSRVLHLPGPPRSRLVKDVARATQVVCWPADVGISQAGKVIWPDPSTIGLPLFEWPASVHEEDEQEVQHCGGRAIGEEGHR